MPNDERNPAPSAKTEVVPAEPSEATAPAEFPSGFIAKGEPSQAEPEALVQAFHFLQKRIPGFVQLTLKEVRSLGRAANLDPDFIDGIIRTAAAWDDAKLLTGKDAGDFREELATTKEWDDAIREMEIVLKGMREANLKRKHALGQAMLRFYAILGAVLRRAKTDDDITHLRPYYDDLRKTLARKKKGKNEN